MDAWLLPIYFGSMSACQNIPNYIFFCISTSWFSEIRFWYVDLRLILGGTLSKALAKFLRNNKKLSVFVYDL